MRVLIALNRELLRYGLIQLLKDVKPIESMVTVGTTEELIEMIRIYEFDLIILSASLQEPKSLYLKTVLPHLKELPPDCKNVLLCNESCQGVGDITNLTHIHGVFSETASLEELMSFFQRLLRGERVNLDIGQSLNKASVLVEESPQKLSKREQQVFQLKVQGYTVKDTAILLKISPKTVENHRRNIRKKLKITKNSDWIQLGKKLGML